MEAKEFLNLKINRPRQNRVIVENYPEESYNDIFKRMESSNLAVPDTAKDKSVMIFAKVLMKGSMVEDLNEGEIVVYHRDAGIELPNTENIDLTLIRDADLLTVYNEA